MSAALARATRERSMDTAKARTIWLQNSTEIPIACWKSKPNPSSKSILVILNFVFYHDQIDEGNSVERDVPPVHDADEIYDDHADGDEDDDGRIDVEAEEDESDDEDGGRWYAHAEQNVGPHGQVLLVEDVEDAVRVDLDRVAGSTEHRRYVGGNDPSFRHGRVVVLRRL